jgi:flagellar hook-length control protein FliK
VVSVTSDVSASATYQNAPPKPALPDPSQLTANFAAMVDSNLPADPSSALPPAPEPAAPPRSANNGSASDNNSPRKTQGSDQPPPSRSDDSSNSSPPAVNNATGAGTNNDAPKKSSSAKSDTSKSSDSKSSDKTSAGSQASGDATDQAKAAEAQTVTQNPIAALIPVATGLANPQTTAANANAPLAIAAAAIAATSSTTAATAPPPLPNTGLAPKGAAAGATNAKTAAQSAALGTTATQQATDPSATTEAAVVSAAGATTAKTTTGFKTTLTQGKAATTPSTGGTPGTSGSAATANANNAIATGAAPQPTVEAKPDSANVPSDAVKPDGNTAASATHDHSQAAGNGQAPAAPIDPNAQLATMPQQLSSTTQVAASDKFTVTQAGGAAVPVSGLAVEIAASVHSGKTQFDVRLDPADLGRIDVRIDVDRNGSHLTVEKPETLSMLRQDASQLQQALSDAGLKTSGSGLQFSLRDQSSSGQNNSNNQSGAQPQRLMISEDDTIPAAVAGRSYGRMLGGNGGVDIRV